MFRPEDKSVNSSKLHGMALGRAMLWAAASLVLTGIVMSQEPQDPESLEPPVKRLAPVPQEQTEVLRTSADDPSGIRDDTLAASIPSPTQPPPRMLPPSLSPPEATNGPSDLRRSLQKLKAEREALTNEHDMISGEVPGDLHMEGQDLTKVHVHLMELLMKLSMRGAARPTSELTSGILASGPATAPAKEGAAMQKTPQPQPTRPAELAPDANAVKTDWQKSTPDKGDNSEGGTPLNPLGLAHVLFRAGNYEQALKAYRMVNLSGVKADERTPIQYLTAACLRKLGKIEEATALFRDVANVRGDDQVAACAQWQLAHLRWRAEAETQLKDLHARRQALESRP